MVVRKVAFLASIIFSSSAGALPSKPLTPANKVQIAKAVKDILKDPDSAKFRWPKPQDWGLYCGWVNAKNSYGGYTGFEPFMIIGGVGSGPKSKGEFLIIKTTIGSGDEEAVVLSMCTKQGFDMTSPPPE